MWYQTVYLLSATVFGIVFLRDHIRRLFRRHQSLWRMFCKHQPTEFNWRSEEDRLGTPGPPGRDCSQTVCESLTQLDGKASDRAIAACWWSPDSGHVNISTEDRKWSCAVLWTNERMVCGVEQYWETIQGGASLHMLDVCLNSEVFCKCYYYFRAVIISYLYICFPCVQSNTRSQTKLWG